LKAVRIYQHGGVEKLLYEEAPDPKLIAPTDAIVKLKAASVNDIDIGIRRGLSNTKVRFPHILGCDGAGIVIETGAEVRNIKPGDAVCLYPFSGCGQCEFCATDREFMCIELRVLGEHAEGTYSDRVRWSAKNCFSIPAGFSFDEAAALPLVYVTVWRMLVTHAAVKPGEHVLIRGIGGGVAAAALQIAAQFGSHVIVTSSSEEKLAQAKAWGAERGINCRDADFPREVRQLTGKRGVDVVVDCLGGDGWAKSLACLAKGGRLVSCGATAGTTPQTDIRRIFWNHLKIFGSRLGSREEFMQVLTFMETSGTKPIMDRVFALREAPAAQERLEKDKPFGKILLHIDE
jgi:NADPH:quinone reductase-like Zn-dependent oxidoreductase